MIRRQHVGNGWLKPLLARCGIVICAFMLGACSMTNQIQVDVDHTPNTLGPADMEEYGVGFLTPAAAMGREADKQALALVFSDQLKEDRPGVTVVPLSKVLGAVNAAELAENYKLMYRDYLETGILERSILQEVGAASSVRYLVQLSLADFSQGTRGRFGVLGLRLFDTKQATLRLFMQIWDSQAGTVAWEASAELNFAYETAREKPVTFSTVAERTAEEIFALLPALDETED
jgi:hypothetical protein